MNHFSAICYDGNWCPAPGANYCQEWEQFSLRESTCAKKKFGRTRMPLDSRVLNVLDLNFLVELKNSTQRWTRKLFDFWD